jgi:hypothetical protein
METALVGLELVPVGLETADQDESNDRRIGRNCQRLPCNRQYCPHTLALDRVWPMSNNLHSGLAKEMGKAMGKAMAMALVWDPQCCRLGHT